MTTKRPSMRAAINAKCKIEDCDGLASKRGLCNAHYIRLRRHGDACAPRRRAENGAGTTTSHGYRLIRRNGVQVYEHIAIAEAALGRPLPPGAQVHHVNGEKSDNRRENLVVCNDKKYHQLLHRRTRALEAVGDPNAIKCSYCGEWDDPENLFVREVGSDLRKVGSDYHVRCRREYSRLRQQQLRSRNGRKTAAIPADPDLPATTPQGQGCEGGNGGETGPK